MSEYLRINCKPRFYLLAFFARNKTHEKHFHLIIACFKWCKSVDQNLGKHAGHYRLILNMLDILLSLLINNP